MAVHIDSDNDDRFADNRTLDEVFRYELEKRSSHEGIALAALGGDRDTIRDFAALGVAALESVPPDRLGLIREWLAFVLSRIEAGVEPNEAFGWKRRRSGALSPSQDFQGQFNQWLIGSHMLGLIEAGKSQRAAAKIVADDRRVSPEEAIRCYRRMMGR